MRIKTRFRFGLVHYILLGFLLVKIILAIFCSATVMSRIVNPLFWTALTIFLYFYTNNNHGRFFDKKTNLKTMLIILLLYIIINILLSLLFGLARNVMSLSFWSIIKNIWYFVVPIVGIEYARSYIVNYCPRNRLYMVVTITMFVFLELNFSTLFKGFATSKELFVYLSSTVAPAVFGSIAFSVLTWYGSYKLVLTFRLPVMLLRLLLPVLPNLDWFMTGVRDSVAPVLICVYFHQILRDKDESTVSKYRRKSFLTYLPVIMIAAIMILFVGNAFAYKPVAVLSNSMVPVFGRGDLIIYHELNKEELKKLEVNDIILYKRDGQIIVHRIVEKYKELGEMYYITKGDANNAIDDKPVELSQILGRYSFSIKYIGYPSVGLYELFSKNTSTSVETGGY